MPTTSPYQNNDYNAVSSFRPFNLPVNSILKGLKAQNEYWDEGARMVKQYYDNALDMNLTLTENQEIRKKFMADADKQLAKLSTMNLADPSVQRQGFGIYKPLFEDEGILLDDAITKKYGSIIAEAQRYKRDQKTKGEGYHTDNLQYALQNFEGFGSGTSRSQLKDIYGKVKNAEYTPYHDVSKEYMELTSKCKPNKMSSNSPQGLYFLEQTDNSLDASKLNGCIKAGLSDKGWQQLRITGSVRLGKDYKTIGDNYANIITGNNQASAQQLVTLAAEKENLKKSGKWTPEVEEAYKEQEELINKGILENNAVLGRMSAGDYSDVEKDYDKIVSQVWANQDIGGFAQAFAYKDITQKWSANAAGIAQMRESGENLRFGATMQWNQMKFGAEMQMKQTEMQMDFIKSMLGGGGSGSGKGGGFSATFGMDYEMANKFLRPIAEKIGIDFDQITMAIDEGKVIEGANETYETINQKANEYHHVRSEAGIGIFNKLKQLVPEEGLRGVYNENGALKVEEVYKLADQYLTKFDEDITSGDKDKKKGYSDKLTQIESMRKMLDEYDVAKSSVWTFMRMRDEIDGKIASDPKLKAALEKSNAQIDNFFKGENGKLAVVNMDPTTGKVVTFTPEDLKRIAKGADPKYAIKGGDRNNGTGRVWNKGMIVIKGTGQELGEVDDKTLDVVETQLKGKGLKVARRYGHIFENGNWNPFREASWVGQEEAHLQSLYGITAERRDNVTSQIMGITGDVVRNTPIYGVGNTPGLNLTLKKQFSAYIPAMNSSDYDVRGGEAYRDGNGDFVTTVKVFKKNNKKSETDEDQWNELGTSQVQALLKDTKYATGGANNIAFTPDGNITIKTNYLPPAQEEYRLNTVVSNEIYRYKNQNLGYQEEKEVPVRRMTGGFNLGFDIVGGGTSFNGGKKPNSYSVWFRTPSGEKKYIKTDLAAENQVSNTLKILEQDFNAFKDAYLRSKK